jgi:hypothetical protein
MNVHLWVVTPTGHSLKEATRRSLLSVGADSPLKRAPLHMPE